MPRWSLAAVLLLATPLQARSGGTETVHVEPWVSLSAKQPVQLYTLENVHGMKVQFSNWGGVVVAIDVPDRQGRIANVALGFDSLAAYRAKNAGYRFGAPIGRYANRIGGARFALDGRVYRLTPNDGPNVLHSGAVPGYDMRLWSVKPFQRRGERGAVLRLVSPDGDQGFPGKLSITMTYRLTDRNEFRIDYAARTSKPTILNLTNHSYFNLAGAGSGDVLGQTIQIMADRVAAVDARKVPTGQLVPVRGGLDLRRPTVIGQGIAHDPLLAASGGYDHAYVLDDTTRPWPVLAARASDPGSGRVMEVLTTEPSLQFYTGNGIPGTDRGAQGSIYPKHGGFALETEHLPDSPNHPAFPTTVLRPGSVYRSTTIYRFTTD